MNSPPPTTNPVSIDKGSEHSFKGTNISFEAVQLAHSPNRSMKDKNSNENIFKQGIEDMNSERSKKTQAFNNGAAEDETLEEAADRFGMKMTVKSNNRSQIEPNNNNSLHSFTMSQLLASKLDNHFKETNLNYVMRRSTMAAFNEQQNPQQSAYRGRSQVSAMMSPGGAGRPGGSLYKKGAAFGSPKAPTQDSAMRRQSTGKAAAISPRMQQPLAQISSPKAQIIAPIVVTEQVLGTSPTQQLQANQVLISPSDLPSFMGGNGPNNRIQDYTPESSFKTLHPHTSGTVLTVANKSSIEEVKQQFEQDILIKAIQDNDVRAFRTQLNCLTNSEISDLKLMDEQLNVVQAISFYNSDQLIDPLKVRFMHDEGNSNLLVDYCEPTSGNKALHFAVLSGNIKIIDFVLQDLKADPKQTTLSGLSALHCAAQFDRGALSLMMFTQRKYGLLVNCKDNFQCTPLHFSVINAQFKCVECLLALGANPNAQNTDGQTALHIAVQKYIQMNADRKNRHNQTTDEDFDPQAEEDDELLYEDLKRIMKELLFNGARRDIKGKFELTDGSSRMSTTQKDVTPYELLCHFSEDIPAKEFKSLKVILDNYSYNQCMMTRRPLQKVEKNAKLMFLTIICNIIVFLFQILFQAHYANTDPEGYYASMFRRWQLSANVLFFVTALCYFVCCCLGPGFIRPEYDIIEMLRLANDKCIDLENFCFYCRVIKSGRTFHCNFCQRCVEKFDHHCTFVNNCLGYRNHKYFIMFIICYTGYFITSTVAAVMSFYTHTLDKDNFSQIMDYIFRVMSIVFTTTQLIPLFYQIKEQTRKLCKRGQRFKGVRRFRTMSSSIDNSGSGGSSDNAPDGSIQKSTHFRRTGAQSFLDVVETKAGFCYNLRQLFCYKYPTQEELRAFLFSDSERFSTFVIKYHKRRPLVSDEEQDGQLKQPLLQSALTIGDDPRTTSLMYPPQEINRSRSPPESFISASGKP